MPYRKTISINLSRNEAFIIVRELAVLKSKGSVHRTLLKKAQNVYNTLTKEMLKRRATGEVKRNPKLDYRLRLID